MNASVLGFNELRDEYPVDLDRVGEDVPLALRRTGALPTTLSARTSTLTTPGR